MNNNNSDSNGFFKIYFYRRTKNKKLAISVKKDYTIKRVKEIIQNITGKDPNIYTLIYRTPVEKEYKTLEEYKIKEGCILVEESNLLGGGMGGFGLNTVDVSKNNTRIVEFDKNAPEYRIVSAGLSVQAKCGNELCKAYNEVVYCCLGFVRDFNLINELSKILCPSCRNEVYPKNFGFLKCEYRIYYEKWENNKKKIGEVKGKAENKFKILDEYSSGNANFSKLIFNVY